VHAIDNMLSQLTDERRKTPDQWSSGTIKRSTFFSYFHNLRKVSNEQTDHSGSILEKKKRPNGFESANTLRPEGSLVFEYKVFFFFVFFFCFFVCLFVYLL
jgi:hypothetical protein